MVAEMTKPNERFARPYAIGAAVKEGSAWHYENAAALRWRDVLLRLSDNMMHASRVRPELAPILFDALDHAIEMLLTQGCEDQLLRLEQWLGEAETTVCTSTSLERDAMLRIAA